MSYKPNPAMNLSNVTDYSHLDVAKETIHRLVTQGQFSFDEGLQRCYYRHPDDPGLSCAVGLLMTDQMYRTGLEERPVHDVLCVLGLNAARFDGYDDLLEGLQVLHDEAARECDEVSLERLAPYVQDCPEEHRGTIEQALRELAKEAGVQLPDVFETL